MGPRISFIPDLLITLPIIFLLSLGILVIYSSDPQLALQQALIALTGLLIYWFLSSVDYRYYQHYALYLYILTIALLVIVFVLGIETRGSLRWISLGPVQIQPSEIAKPVLVIFLANFWLTHLPSWRNILKSFLLVLPVLALVFKQPDLGTALTLGMVWLTMVIGVNISWVKLLVMSILSSVLAPLGWTFLKDYQKARIASFISPDQDPLGAGYNVIQSRIAVGSGGFWGRGLGHGTQSRLRFLPEYRTDFMFASMAEEFGFLGSIIVLALYGTLFLRSLMIVRSTIERFGSLLIFGVLGMLFFQVVVNIGMNIGSLPVTGITLPLLSYGGSSLISTLISLSFIASVARFGTRHLSSIDT